ncbi:MAG: hypothetical protein AB7N71_01530 [Phycisphaerae bacterium]
MNGNNNGNDNANQNDNGNANLNDNAAGPFPTETRSTNIALTRDDRTALVVNREAHSVSLIAVRDGAGADIREKLIEIGVGFEPHSVAIGPNDDVAYVTNTVSGTVSVIQLKGENAFRVIDTIPVGTEPRGCALTPNGRRLFVANHTNRTVTVIDTETRDVVATIPVPGFPQAVAITNDGDGQDADETVFVTEFFAQLRAGGAEAFDDGKEAFVDAIRVNDLNASPTRISLSPIEDVGFTSDRALFCQQLNAAAVFDTYCPDPTIVDAGDDVIANDPQGAFPNQLWSALIRKNRLFLPNIGAGPEPVIRFNVNVQSLVHVVDVEALEEIPSAHVNINEQIKDEVQPDEDVANTVLTRLFGGDLVAIDADASAGTFVLLSRGGNYAMRATLDANDRLDIAAPNVVRFQTGNIPTGIVVSSDGKRCYTNNDVGFSVTAINLETNTVLERDIPSAEPPAPGTFEHGVLVGKLAFFTALGTPDNGVFETPLRDIVPLRDRGKASDNAWSSCTSCHPNGLADGVTWIFATGPRQTIPLDAFFAKDNPNDQRISNWNAVRSGVTDFNNNSRNVQGGIGFAGDPPNPDIYNHGINQGASDALDAQTLWVQTVRPPIMPEAEDSAAENRGRDVFVQNCASCHGGAKWTKSQIIYADNPAFDADPLAAMNPGVPRDPGIINAGAQVRAYVVDGQTLNFIEDVGTFDPNDPIEMRNNAILALGGIGFNVPSLLGVAYHAPYLHSGQAQTLEDVFDLHGVLGGGTIADALSSQQLADLLEFLKTIDGATVPPPNETDEFRAAIGG